MFASSTFGGNAMQNLLDQLKYRGIGGYYNRTVEAMNTYVFAKIAYQGYPSTSSEMNLTVLGKDETFLSTNEMNRILGNNTAHQVREFSVFPIVLMFIMAIFDFFMWWFQVMADGK